MNQRERVAYHEAAHAIAAWALWRPFQYATIVANDESNGHVQQIPVKFVEKDTFPGDYDAFVMDRAVIALAGYIADSVAADATWPSIDAVSDRMAPDDFHAVEFLLSHTTIQVDASIRERLNYDITALLASAYELAESLVIDQWGQIVAVAAALNKKSILTEVEVANVACEAASRMPPMGNRAPQSPIVVLPPVR